MTNNNKIVIIGGGLAGCEAAYQISKFNINVDLYEMRPRVKTEAHHCLLYTSPSPRDRTRSRMPSSA